MNNLTSGLFRAYKSIHLTKGRDALGWFIVEGEKGVVELIRAGWPYENLIVTQRFWDTHLSSFKSWGVESHTILIASLEQMKGLSQVSTPPEVLIIALQQKTAFERLIGKAGLVVALEGINDPGNLGTIIRTVDWFGGNGVLLSEESVDHYNDKVVRSSMGSFFRTPVYKSENFLKDLQTIKERGFKIVAAVPHDENANMVPSGPTCLVMGSESHGLSAEVTKLADFRYSIPGAHSAESLNVAVSAGIIMHQLYISTFA